MLPPTMQSYFLQVRSCRERMRIASESEVSVGCAQARLTPKRLALETESKCLLESLSAHDNRSRMKSRLGQTELQMQYAQLAVPGNCPEGIYMSMAESSDRLSGVIFIRKGYYQGSILHFDVSYPVNDINMAPAVHFAKGSVVHPLIDVSAIGIVKGKDLIK